MKRASNLFAIVRKLAPIAVSLPLVAANTEDCSIGIHLIDDSADIDIDDGDGLRPRDGDQGVRRRAVILRRCLVDDGHIPRHRARHLRNYTCQSTPIASATTER